MTTVYIVNETAQDYSDAEQYGEIRFLSSGSVNIFDLGTLLLNFTSIMKESKGTDYIVLNSTPSLCAIACSIFARKHGRLNLLLFSHGKYVIRTVHVDQYLDTIELEGFDNGSA